jgi:hypothetical protein
MFKVLVVICMVAYPKQCMVLENTQFPVVFETFETCKARALEIGSQVPEYMTGYRAMTWKCSQVREGRFT